ncbi:response regulator transcription factor [Streptomyces sp. IBSNAI002]|uniref:response regulator transcription factor n=1 Tax=Streptomyces sp. IBSNAI002 TaxID=3457500 RepID=UPI003FD4870E
MTVRVMIVDDQPITRSGLRFLVDSIPGYQVVAEAEDGADAVGKAREHEAGLVLMDLRMPRIDGVEATRQLMRMGEPPRVLVMTTFAVDEQALDALEAGAHGFLSKDLRVEELRAAMDVVMSGGQLVSGDMLDFLMLKASRGAAGLSVRRKELLVLLTESERRVLSLLGAGLSNSEIADALYLSVSSVKTYVSRLLQKLNLDNRTQAAVLAYELDFMDG